MAELIAEVEGRPSIRTYFGVHVPVETLCPPTTPDPRRPYGYHRMLHIVEGHAPGWVEFDFGNSDIAKRVATRLRTRHRYEVIWAHDRVFVRTSRTDLRDVIRGHSG